MTIKLEGIERHQRTMLVIDSITHQPTSLREDSSRWIDNLSDLWI